MSYRNLTKTEVTALCEQGCFADNWSKVLVKEGFSGEMIGNTRFSGEVKLGILKDKVEVEKGLYKSSGLWNCYIENCSLGDNVLLSNVGSLVNYDIADNVAIENVGIIAVTGESSFGNGVEIEVLNEGGGRELPIFDKLSAQIAYVMVVYRHDQDFIKKATALIGKYIESKKSTRGAVGRNSRVLNTKSIRNVQIGEYTVISGASALEEGTVRSCREAPVKIGEDVVAREFIILSGTKVDSGAILTSTFVGQGVTIGKQFSAEGSALFANSEGFHSEACSLFGGPYTVTHHKSTLLIASMVSFFNAGSGTNQSNHMYKLGPVHQGIIERGSKTGSFSYMMWPCRVGAYSVLMDKHAGNFDATDLPFSYITVEKGKSVVTPAMNLFTVGTARDTVKWPARDKRKDPEKLDLINFELFNPFIVGKIVKGIELLSDLYETASKTREFVTHKGVSINRLMLKTSRRYYETALHVYIGNEIVKRLDNLQQLSSMESVWEVLKPKGPNGSKWVDLLGMVASERSVLGLMDSVRKGGIKSVDDLHNSFKAIFAGYEDEAYAWCAGLIKKWQGIDVAAISQKQLLKIIADWRSNHLKMNNMILKDAEKEFNQSSRIGFGNDGDETIANADFDAIRGSYEDNKFVKGLREDSERIQAKADKLISEIESL